MLEKLVTSSILASEIADVLLTVRDYAFVAGGAARQVAMAKLGHYAVPASDIDLFLYKWVDFQKAKAALQAAGHYVSSESGNATTFTSGDKHPFGRQVQLVNPLTPIGNRRSGTVEQVLADFSFTTEQFAIECYEADKFGIRYTPDAVSDSKQMKLVINSVVQNPIGLAYRFAKYAQKGYSYRALDFIPVFEQWDRLSPALRAACRAAASEQGAY